jgi:hypothetical protein
MWLGASLSNAFSFNENVVLPRGALTELERFVDKLSR